MKFTIRDKVLAQIEDRAAFLEHLLEEYPRLLRDWTDKTEQSFKKEVENIADDDREICSSIYHSLLSGFNENEYREDIFYKAMVLMVYSYYEGIIEYLIRKTNSDDQVKVLCRANNIELSKEAEQAKEDVRLNIRNLRNHLAHNNLMSSKQKEHIKRISKQWPEISFTDDDISITGSDFILDSLRKEKVVLKELCEKLGYKHKRVQTDKTE